MSNKLKVAVVGAGRMGKIRAEAAQEYGATVLTVCDASLEVATELSKTLPGCKAVTSHHDLDWSRLDAIFICTPPAARGEVELAAIQHHVAFLVEKPVGLSAEAVARIKSELQKKPILNAVGYMNRYRRSVALLRERIAGRIVLGMSADWLVGMYGVPWWADKEGSGGPVNEQATHLLDLARYLLGEIDSVQALGTAISTHPELTGTASINLHFRSGQIGSILYSCQAKEKMIRFQVYLEDESVALTGWDFRLDDDETTAIEYADRNRIFSTEIAAFLSAVESGNSNGILSTFDDALATQRVVDAIHRSFASGCEEPVANV